MRTYRLLLFFLIMFLILWFWVGVINQYITVDFIKDKSIWLQQFVHLHYIVSMATYVVTYIITVCIGLPLVVPLSVLGGYFFGTFTGTVAGVASLLVGSLLYIYLLRWYGKKIFLKKYHEKLQTFKYHMDNYGYCFIIGLHLLLVVPLMLINTLVAIADIPLGAIILTYTIASTPLIFLYTFTGNHLQTLRSFSDIVRPEIALLFLIIALCMVVPPIIMSMKKKHKN